MPIQVSNVTHNNNGHFYRIAIDIAKEGAEAWDLTPYFKGRVGDDNFGLQIVWYYQGRLLDVTGKTPYIKGNVGHYSFDDQKNLQLAPDADVVVSHGNPNDCQAGGQATYYFPQQMFMADGIFKGFIGLQDDNQNLTGVDIWFRVLPGVARMGHACDVYVDILDKTIADFKEKIRQQSIDFDAALQQELQKEKDLIQQKLDAASDAMDEDKAALSKLASAVGAIQAQIDAQSLETKLDHTKDVEDLNKRVDQIQNGVTSSLQKIVLQPKWFGSLQELETAYPTGGMGVFVVGGKLATFENGKWTTHDDISINGNIYSIIINSSNFVAPYNSLGTLPRDSYVLFSGVNPAANPFGEENFGVLTLGQTQDLSVGGTTQMAISESGKFAYRFGWGKASEFSRWFFAKFSATVSGDDTNSPYLNIDTLPAGSVISYDYNVLKTVPWDRTIGCTIITIGGYGFAEQQKLNALTSASIQIAVTAHNDLYIRFSWGYADSKWNDWRSVSNSRFFSSTKDMKAAHTSLENQQSGDVLTFGNADSADNLPWDSGFTVVTLGNGIADSKDPTGKLAGQAQLAVTKDNEIYTRIAWFDEGTEKFTYSKWRAASNYGKYSYLPSLALFNKFAVIGDSYSAGNIHKDDNTAVNDSYLKWGSFIAKKYGTTFTSLAYSGYTAQSFVQEKIDDLKNAGQQDVYFIALGINDSAPWRTQPLGSIDDLHNDSSTNPDSFYGNYGRIIGTIRQVSPNAKIIPITIMSDWGRNENSGRVGFDKAIKNVANKYGLPVVDVLSDPYFKSDEFYQLQISNHPTAVGYAILAERLEKLIQRVIIDNPEYFADTGIQFS